ncbi:uncharacterized protein LOC105196795 precursor [Solenopsis invicta]|uniref:Hymenoptaecin n=1 Tax=Solenopsis invicta TaxID=13686 RepID=I2E7P6_SOLIN|nr:uncharacterized protein LOC105196795 precursor [Solenopsis invicta]AFJ94684.1 hymenoptaecin [Solenopsis invicta]
MKLLVFLLALSCAIVYTSADLSTSPPQSTGSVLPSHESRFRRQTNLKLEEPKRGSITFQGTQPLSGPQRQPTWDLNGNANVFNNGRTTADVYGGLNKVPGQRVQPHFGIQAERKFGNNGFIRGQTQFQQNSRGHGLSPSVGITGGFRFRREAEPQGTSLSFHGTQPLSGPMRQPTWDLNANRNILNNGHSTADIYGGLNKVPGQRVQPHIGIQAERNFGNNGFIRGHGQLQPGQRGHGVSPSVGITGGFRFRREAEPQGTSLSFHGTQPLSGPMRQPTWDLNANRNILNNGHSTADIYGGLNKVPGQRVQPHIGIQAERNFGNNGFIRGHGQLQPGQRGHGVSPSVGITGGFRFRREAEPQGTSLSFHGTQPLSGPMRQPTWDLNANRNILNNGHSTADVYGGLNKVPGQRVQPHIGIQAERNFGNNGFIRGHGQLQPGQRGHGVSPSVGITGGFRFRREAEPQGTSLSFHGTQPLSGPMRQPTWDLNANRNILNNGHSTADVYGGLNKVPGQRVQPHIGIQAERNFGNNGFIRGHGQLQPGQRGHGVSPSVGITGGFRFRREAEPQGTSLNFQATQPLSGPQRQPTWDLNVNRNILNNGHSTADVYGGLNKVPGQRVQPHFGIQAERNFGNNGFIRGQTQFQPNPRGHGLSPSVGITGGFRFRREAEPQGTSLSFHGTQPLSGPMRQPTWDLNANRNILNNGHTTADIYGGLGKVPGQRVQPHIGIQAERNFGNNGFIRGHGQLQPGRGGHGVSPSVGITGGFRFRREAEDTEEVEPTEEY